MEILLYVNISLRRIDFKVVLSNTRLVMNLLLKFNQCYVLPRQLLKVHHNIEKEPLLILNLI